MSYRTNERTNVKGEVCALLLLLLLLVVMLLCGVDVVQLKANPFINPLTLRRDCRRIHRASGLLVRANQSAHVQCTVYTVQQPAR